MTGLSPNSYQGYFMQGLAAEAAMKPLPKKPVGIDGNVYRLLRGVGVSTHQLSRLPYLMGMDIAATCHDYVSVTLQKRHTGLQGPAGSIETRRQQLFASLTSLLESSPGWSRVETSTPTERKPGQSLKGSSRSSRRKKLRRQQLQAAKNKSAMENEGISAGL